MRSALSVAATATVVVPAAVEIETSAVEVIVPLPFLLTPLLLVPLLFVPMVAAPAVAEGVTTTLISEAPFPFRLSINETPLPLL